MSLKEKEGNIKSKSQLMNILLDRQQFSFPDDYTNLYLYYSQPPSPPSLIFVFPFQRISGKRFYSSTTTTTDCVDVSISKNFSRFSKLAGLRRKLLPLASTYQHINTGENCQGVVCMPPPNKTAHKFNKQPFSVEKLVCPFAFHPFGVPPFHSDGTKRSSQNWQQGIERMFRSLNERFNHKVYS